MNPWSFLFSAVSFGEAVYATTSIPMAFATRPTCRPILPYPSTPSRRPTISWTLWKSSAADFLSPHLYRVLLNLVAARARELHESEVRDVGELRGQAEERLREILLLLLGVEGEADFVVGYIDVWELLAQSLDDFFRFWVGEQAQDVLFGRSAAHDVRIRDESVLNNSQIISAGKEIERRRERKLSYLVVEPNNTYRIRLFTETTGRDNDGGVWSNSNGETPSQCAISYHEQIVLGADSRLNQDVLEQLKCEISIVDLGVLICIEAIKQNAGLSSVDPSWSSTWSQFMALDSSPIRLEIILSRLMQIMKYYTASAEAFSGTLAGPLSRETSGGMSSSAISALRLIPAAVFCMSFCSVLVPFSSSAFLAAALFAALRSDLVIFGFSYSPISNALSTPFAISKRSSRMGLFLLQWQSLLHRSHTLISIRVPHREMDSETGDAGGNELTYKRLSLRRCIEDANFDADTNLEGSAHAATGAERLWTASIDVDTRDVWRNELGSLHSRLRIRRLSAGFFAPFEESLVKSTVLVVAFSCRTVPIRALSIVSGPHTKSAPYLSARSREGHSPLRTIGARTILPRYPGYNMS
ncbi:hypothetical protein KC349_g285 [Hortaea werneckii]|nr:hypothetical protein KC349_g285 [Hortaea werneckii]